MKTYGDGDQIPWRIGFDIGLTLYPNYLKAVNCHFTNVCQTIISSKENLYSDSSITNVISVVKRQIGFEVRWTLAASLSRATLFLVNLSLNMLLNKTSCLVGVTKELGLIIQALGVQGPWGLQVYI